MAQVLNNSIINEDSAFLKPSNSGCKTNNIHDNFVDTILPTKFGEFNIRVYADNPGKETMVLWTANIDISLPVLVRVHSECITGDTIGSLQCDCGKQLAKSLHVIKKEGGVLIYLRQEGRGIGLFEKIKAQQLQIKGYDTFEANVLLGHKPDERTYEMVKTVLDDLKIKRIRLLTNNPSKVSEIAKFGIDVVERVPLITKSNKYNTKYLRTKKNKFQHFINSAANYYYYQFHTETPDHVTEIGEFIKNKKRDPLLKICIGIEATHASLIDNKEKAHIHSIYNSCNRYEWFQPILHFSFRNSKDVLKDIEQIKQELPFVNRLQLNDLPDSEIFYIKRAHDLFAVDIPLCDSNFHIVHDVKFRSFLKKNNLCILIDNSKGRGISESQEKFKEKIDILLSYGLNNIALCGGFGPNELQGYFDLKRYYRINFSIDAETKLKTQGKFDLKKIKLYLNQLICFNETKTHEAKYER